MTSARSATARFLALLRDGSDSVWQPIAGDRLCAAGVGALSAGQVALTLSMPDGRWEVLGSAGARAARFADAQAAVSEGPGPDAHRGGAPIRVRELADPLNTMRWPLLAQWTGVAMTGSVCSFPLRLGAIQVGFLDLLDADAIVSTRSAYLDAVQVADVITTLLLSTLTAGDGTGVNGSELGPWWEQSVSAREIHQATGMVAVQLDCTARVAYSRLVGHAFVSGRTLGEVAVDVVARRLRFPPESGGDGRPAKDAAPDPVPGS